MDKIQQKKQDQCRMQLIITHLSYHSQLHKDWRDYYKKPLIKGTRYASHETGFEMHVDPDKGDYLSFNGERFVAWAWQPKGRTIFFLRKTLEKGEKISKETAKKIKMDEISVYDIW